MKTRTLFLAVAIALGTISGFGNNVEKHESNTLKVPHGSEIPEAFKSQLADVLTKYLDLKDALVATDESKATEAAKATPSSLKGVDMMLLKGDAHNKWMSYQKKIKSNLDGIVMMKGIEMKRSHFKTVSDELVKSIKEFEVSPENTVYLEYCPMANNNKGAYWLSESKDIKNPYFGDKMLTCGSVKEVIE